MQQYADIYLLQNLSTCFGCDRTHHQEYKNCNRSLWYSPDLATLEGSSSTGIMTCTGGCGYSF